MAERSLRFDLIARDKSFGKTLDAAGRKGQRLNRELTRTMGSSGDKAGKQFSVGLNKRLGGGFTAAARMATRAVGLIGAAFAGAVVVGWLKGAIDEAREAAKVGRQTAAVIKATGGAANVSAKDVDRLAGALMRKVAVDDDIIATGANMLLTFKGVRNEVGAGNRIFDQATAAAVDMTAAMNKGEVTQEGLQASSIRLGRALNDPIKGVSALTRVGVTFTQGQKDQIKAMVEAGDTMGAQKIILAELKSEFGGAAKAAVDPWQRVQTVLGEVKEQIGTALLPVLDRVATWLASTIPTAVDKTKGVLKTLNTWWGNNKASIETLASILADTFTPTVDNANTKTKTFADTLKGLQHTLTQLSIFVLKMIKVWLALEHVTIGLISTFGSIEIVAGQVINVIDRLSGGTGHAGDQFVKFGRKIKDTARKELQEVRRDAQRAQAAIDRLHGKDVNISGTTSLHFTKSFSQKDWVNARLAAGRMAQGGRITKGTGPKADDVLIAASKGETVVPADASRDAGFKAWAAAKGIPGFSLGGRIGETGTAHTGVGKIMDRWGTLQLAALVKNMVSGGGSAAIKAFIRSTDLLPYIYGTAGPGAYDCSGLVGAVFGKMTGRGGGHGQRYFTTATIGTGGGLKAGLGGTLQIGVTPAKGHMAGRYGGLGFEAASSRTGIKVGGSARRPETFARHFHMAKGGRIDPGLVALFAKTGADIGGDQGKLRINGKVFDDGGMLPPGLTLAGNNTGRPEAVGFDYDKMAQANVRAMKAAGLGAVYLDRQKVSRGIATGDIWESRR